MVEVEEMSRNVLVVDPYPAGRASIAAALTELGHRVVAAATAEEGRSIARCGAIDLIVADADNEAIRRLIMELHTSGTAIPTLMLTTQDHLALPNTAVLEKPTSLDALASAIMASLRS